ncbi:MAG TPA: 23S rRNA (guanosine(2251)-2'-O)-methyltransferase RlmB [Steroidobacteraceae bacterium]|jgi:23S rRNA (guanosine2251-2'-O)-methyltransferase|nr:23S rRNA (guanosine(2251)-2'-O)-methyltransferase RlmB [Steroidobacteraceae bacterium]
MPATPQVEAIYGVHAVRALLLRDPRRVRRVLLQRGRQDARAQEIERLARAAGCPLDRVEGERLTQRLGDVVHQGVAAEVVALTPWDEDALIQAVTAAGPGTPGARGDPLLLALDGVQDPHNLGACLRTADACGALAVIVPRDRAAPLNATARKAAAGAAESTPVAVVTNLARTLRLLKDAGLWIVGASAEGVQRAQDIELTGPRVLVLGAEGAGLRELTKRHCDWLVRLPSVGAVESLNVSVAAGMLLYEAVRQRALSAQAPAGGAGVA